MSVGFAKKIGMTRLFIEGKTVPVTVVLFEKQHVLQKKTEDKEGYSAVQIGSFRKTKATQAKLGHVKKYSDAEHDFLCMSEFKVEVAEDKKVFDINDFSQNDLVDVSGITIGRGFTGAVKRWHFKGQPRSHGHDHVRAVGSMGSRWPQRVTVGKKMAGRHGNTQQTLKKCKIVAIDTEKNLIFINGSMPGANSGFLKIQKNPQK